MFIEKCRLCGDEIVGELCGREKRKLATHLKNKHNMGVEEYLLNGKDWPLCKCGCGNKVGYKKWIFNIYYKDHKNNVPQTDEVKRKIRKSFKDRGSALLSSGKVNVEDLKIWWKKYVDEKESMDEISKMSGHDRRTIVKYWWMFGVASQDEIKRQCRLHKDVYSNQGAKNGTYLTIEDEKLEKIFEYMSDRKNIYTLNDIKEKFNLPFSIAIIYKRLHEKFGKDTIRNFMKLNRGNSSAEEVTFGSVLMFYFGEKNVKTQFVIKYYDKEKKRVNRRFYDYVLFDRLLIEYDGCYWHSSDQVKENDRFKEELALNNGYIFFRVNSKESRNLLILEQIKELVYEIQFSLGQEG